VQVITVFGAPERQPLSAFALRLHEQWGVDRAVLTRRSEDAAACSVLGCAQAILDLPEAIYRTDAEGDHLYPSSDALFGAVRSGDSQLAEVIGAALAGFELDRDTVIYCPTAYGGHIDHVIVSQCGTVLERRGVTVVYYQNFFYRQPVNEMATIRHWRTLMLELSETEAKTKLSAFSQYRSQLSTLFTTETEQACYFAGPGRREIYMIDGGTTLPVLAPGGRESMVRELACALGATGPWGLARGGPTSPAVGLTATGSPALARIPG
jgi:hypothetical protein